MLPLDPAQVDSLPASDSIDSHGPVVLELDHFHISVYIVPEDEG